tara:strand:- start:10840 stop:11988 length:1149 start_codon:yes stop_codon:yes gene_type:complete
MKILVAHNFYRSQLVGGEDIIVRREVNFLKSTLGEQNVFTYFVNNDDLKPLSLLKNIWGDRQHAKNIQDIIVKHNIDILHVHNEFPLLTPLIFKYAAQVGCKVIQTLHNFRNQCLSGILFKQNNICELCAHKKFKWAGIIHKCYRNSYIQSLIHAFAQYWYSLKKYEQYINAYFILTQFQKNKLLDFGVSSEKLFLKPNFIEPLPQQSLGLAERKQYIFIGRIESAKGIDLLLSVWENLPQHFKLIVIGDGPDLKQLQEQYKQANILFKGKCDSATVSKELSQSRYLLQTSLCYETFGLTILEAMQNSVPVMGFDIGTRGEFIEHGHNGFLMTPDNIESIVRESYDYGRYDAMAQKAREKAQAYYQDRIGCLQIQFYEKIIQ